MSPDKNVEAVRAKLLERSQVGLAKYGVTTERTDTDLVGWLNHLQEELMDAAVYVQRSMVEIEAHKPVAFAYYSDKYKKPMLEQTANARGYEGEWKIVPLFAAPVVSPDVDFLLKAIADHVTVRSELFTENQSLKTELEAARKDSDRLDFIAGEYIKVDSFEMATGGDDADAGWRLSQYHMGKPRERVLVEYYRDNLRAAIDTAIEQAKGGAA